MSNKKFKFLATLALCINSSVAFGFDILAEGDFESFDNNHKSVISKVYIFPEFCKHRVQYKGQDFGVSVRASIILKNPTGASKTTEECVYFKDFYFEKNRTAEIIPSVFPWEPTLVTGIKFNCPVYLSDWKHKADPKNYPPIDNTIPPIFFAGSICEKYEPMQ